MNDHDYPSRIVIYALAGCLTLEALLHPGEHPHPEVRQPAAGVTVANYPSAPPSGLVPAYPAHGEPCCLPRLGYPELE